MMIRKLSLFAALTGAALVGAAGLAHAQGAAAPAAPAAPAPAPKPARGTRAGGVVKSVDAGAKSFVVERKTKTGDTRETTVLTTDKTEFKNGEAAAKFDLVKTGVRVRCEGSTTNGKFTATTVTVGRRKKADAAQ